MIELRMVSHARSVFAELTRSRFASLATGAVGSLAIAAIYQLLEQSSGVVGVLLGCLLILAIVVLGVAAYYAWSHRKPRAVEVKAARKGLIVLVSMGRLETAPAHCAIKFHYRGEHDERPEPTLRYLWLIHSRPYPKKLEPPNLSSYDMALRLEELYKPLLDGVWRLQIDKLDDPYEVFAHADSAYRRIVRKLRLKPEEVIADITGGTKSMTIGLAYACIPEARDIEFMKPRRYLDDGRADVAAGSDPYSIDSNFVERGAFVPDRR